MQISRRSVLAGGVGIVAAACGRRRVMGRTNQVLFAGDSISTETYVEAGEGYPALVVAALPEIAANDAVIAAGSTTVTGDGGQGAYADALYDGDLELNILTVLFGANDMVNDSGETFVANLKTWCQARQSTGFTVIVLTVLAHNASGGVEIPRRNTANALIRSDPTFYDALADIALDPTMGGDDAPDNETYFGDGLHPTAAGYVLLAPYVERAIRSLVVTSAGRNL